MVWGAWGLPQPSLAAAPSSLGLGEGLISSHLPLYKEEAPQEEEHTIGTRSSPLLLCLFPLSQISLSHVAPLLGAVQD